MLNEQRQVLKGQLLLAVKMSSTPFWRASVVTFIQQLLCVTYLHLAALRSENASAFRVTLQTKLML